MSEIVVENVRAEGGRVSYDYDYSPDLRRFFAEDFAVEYDVDVSDVPESILVVPLLANLCPVAWAAGADVYVPRVDETFLHALPKVARALEAFYPRLVRGGRVRAGEAVDNSAAIGEGKSGMLFSGGVDSTATYLRHRDEAPTLISVHGFDFTLDEQETWSDREPFLREFATSRGLDNRFVRMNMQGFLNLVMLNAHFGEHYDDNWITSVHHGLSLLGTCAPLTVAEGIDGLYIASTFSEEFPSRWGSHPTIDEEVAWANVTVTHDDYDVTRQEKIYRIADYVREESPDLEIRTCMRGSENCSRCEGCVGTMMGLLLAGLDPAEHGFDPDEDLFQYARTKLERGNWPLSADEQFMWQDIQNHADPDQEGSYPSPYSEATEFFAWLRAADIDALAESGSSAETTDSVRNRVVYAVARHTPYPVYSRLYSAYSSLGERLSG